MWTAIRMSPLSPRARAALPGAATKSSKAKVGPASESSVRRTDLRQTPDGLRPEIKGRAEPPPLCPFLVSRRPDPCSFHLAATIQRPLFSRCAATANVRMEEQKRWRPILVIPFPGENDCLRRIGTLRVYKMFAPLTF